MSNKAEKKQSVTPLTASTAAHAADAATPPHLADIEAFLKRNPDFFLERPDLLEHLALPFAYGENVVGIQEFQLHKTKQKLTKLQQQNKLLLDTSLANMRSEEKLRAVLLRLLRCRDFAAFTSALHSEMQQQFAVESVTLHLCRRVKGVPFIAKKDIEALFTDYPEGIALRTLYTDMPQTLHTAGGAPYSSDALLRLTLDGKDLGVIALASTQATRFHAGQGIELLAFVGAVMAVHIEHLLKLAR